jgi:DNA repair protein RecN (Recombination protein N)
MLVELRIRNYAVVEDLSLTLRPGLNVLTGETGAGKSIVVDALSLLLGERASSGVVRAGADRAAVEAAFDVTGMDALQARLEELGFSAEDGQLILRREVASEGRNRAWVNGSPATASVVGELGSSLVDMHGQHEHQTLLRQVEQRTILDAYAGAGEALERVAKAHAAVRARIVELHEREARSEELREREEFLSFQLQEIDAANVHAGEDEELDAEADRYAHLEELLSGAGAIHEELYGGENAVADRIAEARAQLTRMSRIDPTLEELARLTDDAYHAVAEAGRRVGDYASGVEHDPRRLEEIRERLDALFRLKRKYGPELADVLETARRVRDELAELEDAAHDVEVLRERVEAARDELREAAAELTHAREGAGGELAESVRKVLPDLGLTAASFEIRLRSLDEIGAAGAEAVEFLVSPNPGFEPMALARIASGGELSRVMLALKSILAEVDRVPVLIFDEIDAGVGGVVATAVARKLAEVAERHQVFVVTHLPQLACRAAAHLLVEKKQGEDNTVAQVRTLDGEDRVAEIARMLGGDPESSTSRDHAREMLAAWQGGVDAGEVPVAEASPAPTGDGTG